MRFSRNIHQSNCLELICTLASIWSNYQALCIQCSSIYNSSKCLNLYPRSMELGNHLSMMSQVKIYHLYNFCTLNLWVQSSPSNLDHISSIHCYHPHTTMKGILLSIYSYKVHMKDHILCNRWSYLHTSCILYHMEHTLNLKYLKDSVL